MVQPKHPIGTIPGADFVDTGDTHGIKVGLLTRIDEINLKGDIKVLTGSGYLYEADLTQAMAGPRSFWGGVPEVGSLIVFAYRRKHKQLWEPVILGFLPSGNKSGMRFDPFSPVDTSALAPEDVVDAAARYGGIRRIKRLKLRPGDVGGMSASGSELTLTRDVVMTNRAGDLFELRDAERTLVAQTIHAIRSEAGVRSFSGPARRSSLWLPPDIFGPDGRTLLTDADGYYGRDELQAAGPGGTNTSAKFAGPDGVVLDIFNDANEFPPITYANGRRVFYPSTSAATNFEQPRSAGAYPYVENRLEMSHTTDMVQEVLGDVDGFPADRREPYIERVYGTLVGNDLSTTMGQRQYGRLLKPRIFDDFNEVARDAGFSLEEVPRNPMVPDIEASTTAGAYLLRIRPPRAALPNTQFAMAVSKQGKLFLNVPGSTVERSASSPKNVSMEMNLGGALKFQAGAATPDGLSIHAVLAGGIKAVFGHSSTGQAVDVEYRSGYTAKFVNKGTTGDDGVAFQQEIEGIHRVACVGEMQTTVQGARKSVVSGAEQVHCDRHVVNAFGGASLNCGEHNVMVAGKAQYNHALAVLENIALGGKISTILAGGLIQNIAAGAMTYNVLAGATAFNCPAGAYAITVGTGALALTTAAGAVTLSTAAGAMSIAAGAGAVAITAGLAMNLAASTAISLVAPQILLGGPIAVLGVCRGTPMYPPGAPSLDWITGLPLQGGIQVRAA